MSQAKPESTQPQEAPIALQTLSRRSSTPQAGALDKSIMRSTGSPVVVGGYSNGAFDADSEAPASEPPADSNAIRKRHDRLVQSGEQSATGPQLSDQKTTPEWPDPEQTQRGATGARGNAAAEAQGTGHQAKSEKEMLTSILVDTRGSPGSNKVAPDEKPLRPNGVCLLYAHTNTRISYFYITRPIYS